jgi:hypothetical protein
MPIIVVIPTWETTWKTFTLSLINCLTDTRARFAVLNFVTHQRTIIEVNVFKYEPGAEGAAAFSSECFAMNRRMIPRALTHTRPLFVWLITITIAIKACASECGPITENGTGQAFQERAKEIIIRIHVTGVTT